MTFFENLQKVSILHDEFLSVLEKWHLSISSIRILTISVISDDNTRNELSSFGFDDVDEAKRNYSDYLQSLYKDCMDKGYPIDFDYTYVFDKNNGITVINVLDPSASEEAGKQIMHRYNVILSTPQDDSQI